jgi:RND family efflux transporter MFP subunit
VQAINRAELSSELAGRVTKLPFRMGDSFSKGDVLVGLDCQLYEAQASKVAAELNAATVKLKSAAELQELNAIGELDVALAESEYAQSKAELAIARLNSGRCNIRAPWDGRVAELRVSRHENVKQQQPLISIVDDSTLEAEVVVPANWLAWLKPGQPAELKVEGLEMAAEATVSAISPSVDAVSQTVLLRAAIAPEAALVPGITGTAVFLPISSEDQ